jgi:hypothetical protein
MTSHGPGAELEQPIEGADQYVAVSEEVRDVNAKAGFTSEVIRQPIDLERFTPQGPINMAPKKILAISKTSRAAAWISMAGEAIGAQTSWVRGWDRARWDMEDQINDADIVVSCGRGAVEGMACGRAVLSFDYRPYNGQAMCDGWIHPDTLSVIQSVNYSTRGFNAPVDGPEPLLDAMGAYEEIMGDTNRLMAVDHHDVRIIAQEYLELIR